MAIVPLDKKDSCKTIIVIVCSKEEKNKNNEYINVFRTFRSKYTISIIDIDLNNFKLNAKNICSQLKNECEFFNRKKDTIYLTNSCYCPELDSFYNNLKVFTNFDNLLLWFKSTAEVA